MGRSEDAATRVACRAIPAAARRGWREDTLCASLASGHVSFHGSQVPVCRMHSTTYLHWGMLAETLAADLWGWRPDTRSTGDAGAPPSSYAMPY